MGALLALPAAAMALPAAILSALCCCCTAVNCACTAASCVSCCFRGSLGRRSGVSPLVAKLFYIVVFFLCAILALILRFNSQVVDLGLLSQACNQGNVTVTVSSQSASTQVFCRGTDAVFRITFILTLFFGAMVFLSAASEGLHRGFWIFKIVAIVGGIIGCFFIPSGVLDTGGYAWSARIGGGLFLLMQVLVLIDFSYNWNEDWVARAYAGALTEYSEAPHKNWLYAILASAALLYAGSIAGIALLFVYYGTCPEGTAFTVVALLLILLNTVVSLFRDKIVGVPGAILPVATVTAYTVFLTWSALESSPNPKCRPGTQTAASIIIGGVFAVITLCWTTFSLTSNQAHLVQGEELEKAPELEEALTRQANDGGAADGGAPTATSSSGAKPKARGKRNAGADAGAGAGAAGAGASDVEMQQTSVQTTGDLGLNKKKQKAVDAAATSEAGQGLVDGAGAGSSAAGSGAPAKKKVKDADAHDEDVDDEPWPTTERSWVFHIIMVLASMYTAMLLSDWGSSEIVAGSSVTGGSASLAIKETVAVLTSVLFLWTLIAPAVCKGRDFSQ